MIPGIDLSSHNSVPAAPWASVRSGFAFVRVTMGATGRDTAAAEHLARGAQAGCPALGAYHFLRADSAGERQAEGFLARVHELEQVTGPLLCAVDVEDMPPPHPPWDLAAYRRALLDFLDVLSRAGRVCAVYVAPWMADRLALPPELAACPLWLAHWVSVPKPPKPWSTWQIWQYGVEGVQGQQVDRNRYRGTAQDLRELFRLDSQPAFDSLGPVVTSIHAARGQGPGGAEDFVTGPGEGVIDDGG